MIKVAVIGARGYVGAELLRLIDRHPGCELTAVGSRSLAGEPLAGRVEGMDQSTLVFEEITPRNLDQFPADAYFLALPNGHAAGYVSIIDDCCPDAVVIDVSADYRFDPEWAYGLPERFADTIRGARRIANPGCYATGAQLSLAPVREVLDGVPAVFGVSGYSGAGTTPSPKNDPNLLRDNLMPYSLTDHLHEREISHHLEHDVRFLPHVAEFFRGIALTVAGGLKQATDPAELLRVYETFYAAYAKIQVQADIPWVTGVRNSHGVIIGGFSVQEHTASRFTLVCVLDNLLKGAATQAVQNLNLAFELSNYNTGLENE